MEEHSCSVNPMELRSLKSPPIPGGTCNVDFRIFLKARVFAKSNTAYSFDDNLNRISFNIPAAAISFGSAASRSASAEAVVITVRKARVAAFAAASTVAVVVIVDTDPAVDETAPG